MQSRLQDRRIVKGICALMLWLFVSALAIGQASAGIPQGSASGTRVVKVALPAPSAKKAAAKKPAEQANAPEGKAAPSEYNTPNMDSTVQEDAARVWFLGVLGGDREYSVSAPALFKVSGSGIKETDAVRFIVLRESLYTASSWAMGMARIESLRKSEKGMDASIYLADIEPLVSQEAEDLSARLRIEPPVARILAEWKVSSWISSGEKVRDIRYATVVKTAPVNAFGVLSLGPNALKELMGSIEDNTVKAISAAKKYKLAYATPYIKNIAFIVRYSPSLNFSPELKKALE